MRTYLFSLLGLALLAMLSCAETATKNQESNASEAPVIQDIDQAAFEAKMNDPNVVILDVRTPDEIAAGKIDGAMELDFRAPDFADKLKALDKEKTYLVYCQSGMRSANACSMMADQGFKEMYNLVGGYGAWEKE